MVKFAGFLSWLTERELVIACLIWFVKGFLHKRPEVFVKRNKTL